MPVTSVSFRVVNSESSLVATSSIVFDDLFLVGGIRIMNGSKGLFVAMPSAKIGTQWKDTSFPLTAEYRKELSDLILAQYDIFIKQEKKEKKEIKKEKKQKEQNNTVEEVEDELPF